MSDNDIARRACIHLYVDEAADAKPPRLSPPTWENSDWVSRLTASLGCVAAQGDDDDLLDHYLMQHAADVQLWLEARSRGAAL